MEKSKKTYDVITFMYEENGPQIDECKTFQTLSQAKKYVIDYCKKFIISEDDFEEFKEELSWRKFIDIFGTPCYGVDTIFDSDEGYPVIVENKSQVNNTKTKNEELNNALSIIEDAIVDIEESINDIILSLNTFNVNTAEKKYATIAQKINKSRAGLVSLLKDNLPIRE